MNKHILVTGAAGFIGFHLCKRLLKEGFRVTGVDNINAYYSRKLKFERLKILSSEPGFTFFKLDIADASALEKVFGKKDIEIVCHLAAQAGVRHSLSHPEDYIHSNLVGFANVLECCRNHSVRHLIFASSSSVYGLNTRQPFRVDQGADHPVSLYAATKKSNELMAHAYTYLYGLPATGLRFFTVYGPWGRPDMAYYKFALKIMNDEPIEVYNNGDMARDFTYIDDIVESLYRLLYSIPVTDAGWDSMNPVPGKSTAPFRIYNIGNNAPVPLMEFVQAIERELGKEARIKRVPMQPGDVRQTWADSSDLYAAIDFIPATSLTEGIRKFVGWYKNYHQRSVGTSLGRY